MPRGTTTRRPEGSVEQGGGGGFQLGLDIAEIKARNPDAIGCILGGHGITAWGETSEDAEAKSVTASIPLIASDTATYREGYGCLLQEWQD